ncbi:MAG: hypothetical protein U9Q81_08360, partial [Pseudomonadota bacterium]|nr:hypothetical protein [Pseudomonadota bacterium]
MNQNFTKLAFTDSVKKAQERYGIPLPTTLPDAALSLEREHEIGDALQTDPERFRAREAIVFP